MHDADVDPRGDHFRPAGASSPLPVTAEESDLSLDYDAIVADARLKLSKPKILSPRDADSSTERHRRLSVESVRRKSSGSNGVRKSSMRKLSGDFGSIGLPSRSGQLRKCHICMGIIITVKFVSHSSGFAPHLLLFKVGESCQIIY